MAAGGVRMKVAEQDSEERWRVSLLWEDWVKALDELARSEKLFAPELKNSFFIFIHGCEAILHGDEVKSRLGTTPTKMENLRPKIVQRPRFLERAIDVLLAIIKQPASDEATPSDMLSKAGHMLVQFHRLQLPTFLVESHYYHRCFAALSYFVNHCGPSVSDSLRTSILRVLHSLDDLRMISEHRTKEADAYASAFPGQSDLRIDMMSMALPYIRNNRSSHSLRSQLSLEADEEYAAEEALVLESLCRIPKRWLTNQESFTKFIQLLQVLSSIEEELGDEEDLDIFAFYRSCLDTIMSFVSKFHEGYSVYMSHGSQDRNETEVELFEELIELSRVVVAYHHNLPRRKALETLEDTLQRVADTGTSLFSGSPSKFLRILSLIPTAIESDTSFDVLLTNVLPNTFNVVLEHMDRYDFTEALDGKGKEEHAERAAGREAVLGKALDYASAAVSRPHHSERLLSETLRLICRVGDICIPPRTYFAVQDAALECDEQTAKHESNKSYASMRGQRAKRDKPHRRNGKAKETEKAGKSQCKVDKVENFDPSIDYAQHNLRKKCDKVYQNLLQLGLMFLRQTSEIDHINYLFSTSLPHTLQRTLSWNSESTNRAHPSRKDLRLSSDMLTFIIRLLDLAIATIEIGMNKMTLFHLYLPGAIDAFRNLQEKNAISFEECTDLSAYCFEQLASLANKRSNVTLVLTHGIPVLTELHLNPTEFRSLWKHVLHTFHIQSNFGLLLHLKDAYDFLLKHFGQGDYIEAKQNRKRIRRLIVRLISEGSREDVRSLCYICQPILLDVTFQAIHRLLLAYGDAPVSASITSDESTKPRDSCINENGDVEDEMALVKQYLEAQHQPTANGPRGEATVERMKPQEFSELIRAIKLAMVLIKEAPPPAVEEVPAPPQVDGEAGEVPPVPDPQEAALHEERERIRQQQREAERQARIEENRLIREGTVALVSYILRLMAQHWEHTYSRLEADIDTSWVKLFTDELSRVSLFKILYADDLAQFARRREPRLSHQEVCTEQHLNEHAVATDEREAKEIRSKEQEDEEMAGIFEIFRTKFPKDVAGQQMIMSVLTALSLRVETIRSQRPKFMHVADKAIECLNQLLAPHSEEEQMMVELQELSLDAQFELRRQRLERYVWSLQGNIEERQRLIEAGYAEDLWDWNSDLAIEVETEEAATWRLRLDQAFTNKLLECYREYTDILHDLQITSVPINNVAVPIESIFTEGLSLEEMKGRRSLVIQSIRRRVASLEGQQGMESEHTESNSEATQASSVQTVSFDKEAIAERKHQLLEKEERIENDWNRERQKGGADKQRKPGGKKKGKQGNEADDHRNNRKRYLVRLHTSYLSTLSACGAQITGCYAPNGVHAEKPIENALKANVVMLSIYMEDLSAPPVTCGTECNDGHERLQPPRRWGPEIESIEAILTDQGLFLYKSYATQHGEDTSLAWATFLKQLVESNLVPAVIVPAGHPDARTFSLLSSAIPAHYMQTLIAYRDNFFAESGVESYYDSKPEKIKVGDLLLTNENVTLLELPTGTIEENKQTGSSTLLRSSSELKAKRAAKPKPSKESQKDLVGTIVTNAMQALRLDGELQKAAVDPNIFGRHVGQYVTVFLDTLERKRSILSVGFDLNMWNSRAQKRKKGKAEAKLITEAEKELIVARVAQVIDSEIEAAYHADLGTLLNENRVLFFELKSHLEKMVRIAGLPRNGVVTSIIGAMRAQLREHSEMVEIASLERTSQEQLIRWIFRNEDKVWRDRGGRPGEETLQQFQALLSPNSESGGRLFPGLVMLSRGSRREAEAKEATTKQTKRKLQDLNGQGCSIVAYCIGEFTSPGAYEVITAWVDDGYRGMNIANQLYMETARHLHALNRDVDKESQCHQVVCDVLEGSLERIVAASPLLAFLWWTGIGPKIIEKRHSSYVSETDTGTREQFERLVISLPVLMNGSRLFALYTRTSSVLQRISPSALFFHEAPSSNTRSSSMSVLEELDHAVHREVLSVGDQALLSSSSRKVTTVERLLAMTWPRPHRPVTGIYASLLRLAYSSATTPPK